MSVTNSTATSELAARANEIITRALADEFLDELIA